jgi:hypothetical protein
MRIPPMPKRRPRSRLPCARLLAGLLALLLGPIMGPASLRAQDAPQIPVYRLDLRSVPDIPEGTAALVDGVAGPQPQRFFVENLHMLMPVSVTLRSVNASDDVKLRIVKGKWDAPLLQGGTGGGQQVNFRFRTQGEFQLQVDSAQAGSPYKLVVWVGPDLSAAQAPVFVPRSEFESGGRPLWHWLAGGAVLLLLLGGAAVTLIRRRKS